MPADNFNSTEQVRRDQSNFGRRENGLIGSKKPNPQRRVTAPKGHDAILKAAVGKSVRITFSGSGDSLVGKLVDSDKYALVVEYGTVKLVIYKHAIESFSVGA
jgi:sRNA-binding regulator protein Hfq